MSFDGECDFVRDFALHYPLRVIMSLFGVPPEDEPQMLKLTQEFFGVHDPEEQREGLIDDPVAAAKMWYASLQDFYTYFDGLSAERRREPRDDLLSLIANAQVNGQPMPRDEANGYFVAIATAGHDTTSSSTAGGMHGLTTDADQFAMAQSGQGIAGLVDEAIPLDLTGEAFHAQRRSRHGRERPGHSVDGPADDVLSIWQPRRGSVRRCGTSSTCGVPQTPILRSALAPTCASVSILRSWRCASCSRNSCRI